MIKEFNGNILDLFKSLNQVAIIHGNNCENNMGKGLAKTLKDKFSRIWKPNTKCTMGDFEIIEVKPNKYIINAYTQVLRGKPNNTFDTYEIRKKALRDVFRNLKLDPNTVLLIPRIGAGLAGGNWEDIKNIILENIQHENIIFVTYGG